MERKRKSEDAAGKMFSIFTFGDNNKCCITSWLIIYILLILLLKLHKIVKISTEDLNPDM